jgi:hypothetical protein
LKIEVNEDLEISLESRMENRSLIWRVRTYLILVNDNIGQYQNNCVHIRFFPRHSFVEDKKISGDKRSGSDMLCPKIGDRCPHF